MIRPFPAYLVKPEWAGRVVSPMHDVLTQEERAARMAANPYSYLHVARQPGDDGPGIDPGRQAAAALARLLSEGAFAHYPDPALYTYELAAAGHRQLGLVAEVPIEAFEGGDVRGHEDVHPDRVEALVRHHIAVPGRSALVALMFASDPRFEALTADGELLLEYDDGLRQTVRRLADDRELSDYFASRRLYITDGHHRVAAALEEWWRDGRPRESKVLSVIFPDTQLRALAFHRRVAGPLPDGWLDELADFFEVEAGDGTARRGSIALYRQGEWRRLTQRRADSTDVAALHRDVIRDLAVEYISEVTPLDDAIARTDEDGGALFLLAPPTCAQIMEVADRGEVMEAKSTYFDPKPRSGVFLRFPGE